MAQLYFIYAGKMLESFRIYRAENACIRRLGPEVISQNVRNRKIHENKTKN